MHRMRLFQKIMLSLGLGLIALSSQASSARPAAAEVIHEWNALLETVIPVGGLNPPRQYAMLHVAMFDAVNSIERKYGRYRFSVWASPVASPEAAAAQAAHDVLINLYPASTAVFDQALATRLAGIQPFRAKLGSDVGKAVAAAVLAWRANDGWNTTPPAFVLPPIPGAWQPTPPAMQPAGFTQFPNTLPFALLTPTQYLPRRPPSLDSAEYAEDLNEVKRIGSATSTERTAEQAQLARIFASVTSSTVHWAVWNHVARDTARAKGLSMIETARLYALVNVSIHDGLQTSHSSKFVYGLWRPVTAIRLADEDLNALTDADPSWLPLLTTPPYPSHSGNMACVGASAASALALFHDTDAIAFSTTWVGSGGNPDVTRSYQGFWQLAEDQANSRVYGGIHFRFENEASQATCPRVPAYVFSHYMQPRG
jgi:hypothetical protein